MVLVKPEPLVLDDGKHWEADRLDRKKVADYLTPLVESITQPFVISLSSDYGTGKTFFIKCWRKDLEVRGFTCVYFNAWETDFSQDPLFAFIAAMKRAFGEMTGADAKLNEAAKRAGGVVVKKLAMIAGKAGLRAVLGADAARDALDLTNINAEEIVEASAKYAEDRLREQESAEKSLLEFKTYLESTIKELVAEKNDGHKKIVIFVDDLDRCRPDYAISVLECIKHLFAVNGLVFVLGIDDNQISQAVKAVYGPSIDADSYLRRFIDWNFRLPKPSVSQFIDFMLHSTQLHGIFLERSDASVQAAPEFVRVFAAVSDTLGFSLRKIEQVFTELNLTLRSVKQLHLNLADRFALLACLRHITAEKLSANLNDRPKLIDYITRNLPNLELITSGRGTRFIKLINALPLWSVSIERFEELSGRIKVIESRLNQIQEIRLQNRDSGGTLTKERDNLVAEEGEIQLVMSSLKAADLDKDCRDLTFFELIYRQLDATAYIYSSRK